MLTPREKNPSTGTILPRGGSNPRHCIKQDSEPNTPPMSYSLKVFNFCVSISLSVMFCLYPCICSSGENPPLGSILLLRHCCFGRSKLSPGGDLTKTHLLVLCTKNPSTGNLLSLLYIGDRQPMDHSLHHIQTVSKMASVCVRLWGGVSLHRVGRKYCGPMLPEGTSLPHAGLTVAALGAIR